MENNDVQRVKETAAAIAREIRALAVRREAPEIAARLDAILDQLDNGSLNVVVCGEFKLGKSSFINALLREPNLLPVNTDITTAAVTRIAWGPQEKIVAHLEESGRTTTVEIGRADLAHYVARMNNAGGKRRVWLVSIELPNPLLSGGLVLVDTPGNGGIAIEHSEITYGFLPHADLILYVLDSTKPMTEHEITFLKDRIAPFRRDVIAVLNRTDMQRNWRTIAEADRNKLDEALGDYSTKHVRMMPCSPRLFFDFLETQDPADAEESFLPPLEAAILEHVGTHGAKLLALRALEGSEAALAELRAPVETALATLNADSAEALAELQHGLEDTQKRLGELKQSIPWRKQMMEGFTDIKRRISFEEQSGRKKVFAALNLRLGDDQQMADLPRIGRETVADLQTHRAMLNQTATELVTMLRAKIARTAKLTLPGAGDMQDNQILPDNAPGLDGLHKRQPFTRRAFTAGRMSVVSTGAGGAIGAVIGGAIGGALGFVFGGIGALPGATAGSHIGGALGSFFGGYQGLREGLETVQQREIGETRKAVSDMLMPFLDTELLRIFRGQEEALADAERATQAEFEGEIETALRINKDQIAVMTEQRAMHKADVADRKNTLNAVMHDIQALDASLRQAAACFAGEEEPTGDADAWAERPTSQAEDVGIGG